jgi:hypothetical protein
MKLKVSNIENSFVFLAHASGLHSSWPRFIGQLGQLVFNATEEIVCSD